MEDNRPPDIDIEEYYVKYGPMVLRRCRKLLQNEEQAMDAMQEVFVKLLLYKKRLRGSYPSSLLFRIATNTCLNILRAKYNHKRVYNNDILANIAMYDEHENRMINNSVLENIFRREKKSTREIAVMFFVDRMTLKEVADEVGLSISGVRRRIRVLKARIQNEKEVCYE